MVFAKIPNYLLSDLIELQKVMKLSVQEIVEIAIQQFIDREKSNDEYVWVNGIRYPIPVRMP